MGATKLVRAKQTTTTTTSSGGGGGNINNIG
jgi:hypothetical protein